MDITIHQAERIERRGRRFVALAILAAIVIITATWLGLFAFLTANTAHGTVQDLRDDWIPDVLEARRQNNELKTDVWERYAKHVKAVVQVGTKRDETYAAFLGYPAEIVPLVNPYVLKPGDELSVVCLVDGEPVANQPVLLGGEIGGDLVDEQRKRTDSNGKVSFVIESAGRWYVEFINMVPMTEEDLDYESKWATLAFEIR